MDSSALGISPQDRIKVYGQSCHTAWSFWPRQTTPHLLTQGILNMKQNRPQHPDTSCLSPSTYTSLLPYQALMDVISSFFYRGRFNDFHTTFMSEDNREYKNIKEIYYQYKDKVEAKPPSPANKETAVAVAAPAPVTASSGAHSVGLLRSGVYLPSFTHALKALLEISISSGSINPAIGAICVDNNGVGLNICLIREKDLLMKPTGRQGAPAEKHGRL
ncbi:hypothetical protein PTTG_28008 [Puccinia triticina 1-1 BBBD Race 1]|uniref:Uncharacterized protein n=1 Tax=Puccinia triticina (isolate 1-1 / race 1 (BBBD)) TaxID=630390 RepID=A0A180GGB5_PUCT1|nr:hypothetical protein PTTG_28008 [Puccinia triticina 1-1 BBBD Race 1]